MRARDTTETAAEIQEELHRKLGPGGRVELAMRMSELAHEFAKSGVRNRNPALSDSQVMRELARVLYGR
ncbi:MAG TPA: hypothetical protein VMT00_05460 [Thermoanaerobaculia bacterium]|nr:hypothetical protein [Thermoanaerobaculia bacterium]